MGIAKYFINTLVSGVVAGGVYYYLDKKAKEKNSRTTTNNNEAVSEENAPNDAADPADTADDQPISDEAAEAIGDISEEHIAEEPSDSATEIDINQKVEEITAKAKEKATSIAESAKKYADKAALVGLDVAEKTAVTVMEKSLDARKKLAEKATTDTSDETAGEAETVCDDIPAEETAKDHGANAVDAYSPENGEADAGNGTDTDTAEV